MWSITCLMQTWCDIDWLITCTCFDVIDPTVVILSRSVITYTWYNVIDKMVVIFSYYKRCLINYMNMVWLDWSTSSHLRKWLHKHAGMTLQCLCNDWSTGSHLLDYKRKDCISKLVCNTTSFQIMNEMIA